MITAGHKVAGLVCLRGQLIALVRLVVSHHCSSVQPIGGGSCPGLAGGSSLGEAGKVEWCLSSHPASDPP